MSFNIPAVRRGLDVSGRWRGTLDVPQSVQLCDASWARVSHTKWQGTHIMLGTRRYVMDAVTLKTIAFEREKDTKNCIRFKEVAEPGAEVIGTLYVKKAALSPTVVGLEVSITAISKE